MNKSILSRRRGQEKSGSTGRVRIYLGAILALIGLLAVSASAQFAAKSKNSGEFIGLMLPSVTIAVIGLALYYFGKRSRRKAIIANDQGPLANQSVKGS